jgi:hypothetical protein
MTVVLVPSPMGQSADSIMTLGVNNDRQADNGVVARKVEKQDTFGPAVQFSRCPTKRDIFANVHDQ